MNTQDVQCALLRRRILPCSRLSNGTVAGGSEHQAGVLHQASAPGQQRLVQYWACDQGHGQRHLAFLWSPSVWCGPYPGNWDESNRGLSEALVERTSSLRISKAGDSIGGSISERDCVAVVARALAGCAAGCCRFRSRVFISANSKVKVPTFRASGSIFLRLPPPEVSRESGLRHLHCLGDMALHPRAAQEGPGNQPM